jgi:dihydroorotase
MPEEQHASGSAGEEQPDPGSARRPAGDAGASYDILIRSGEVIDPGAGRSGRFDVAIAAGRIAEVAPGIAAGRARRVIDATGDIVVPGLVDLHTHVFWGGTYWGVDPAALAHRTGVTTWIDAGSSGAFTVGAFKRSCVQPAPVRIRALLNISSAGLTAETGESARPELCDPALCAEMIRRDRGFLLGIKCRMDHRTVGDQGLTPLRKALAAAEETGVPVMVHIGTGPPGIDDVLNLLRSGDIVTHCTTGQGMALAGPDGRLLESARRARARGVLLDVGHGYAAFSFPAAEALLRDGAPPDVISSDAHQRSVRGPMRDLPTCLGKYLALGMSVTDVIRAATTRPAQAIGLDGTAGTLTVGRAADVAVFTVQEGRFAFHDVDGHCRYGERQLVNRLTLAGGAELPAGSLGEPPPWIPAEAAP